MKKILISPYFYLLIIISLGLIFRLYKLEFFSPFALDEDLYSWIVKDILVDHHIRLIGQLTSIDGVFIGPFFYYLLVPFFALFSMDPVGAIVPSTIIGIITIISIYYVFSNFFNRTSGLIGSLIYAVSLNIVLYDRWIVPTMLVPLWSIWLLYILFCIEIGEYKRFWILGVLAGLIWHIHIALLPLLGLIPIALFFTKTRPKIHQFALPLLLTIVLMIPFLLFETRHNFQQSIALLSSFGNSTEEAEGMNRLSKIIDASSVMMIRSLFSNWPFSPLIIYLIIFGGLIILKLKKILENHQLILILCWFFAILGSQEISKRGISEYYFASLIIFPILCISLVLNYLNQNFKKIKIAILLIFIYVIYNLISFLNLPVPGESLAERKQVVDFIVADAKENNYPCIQINYITGLGNNTGFRYLFWWKNLQLIKSGVGAPVYSIVLPWTYSPKESNPIFGKIGVIKPPKQHFVDTKTCENPANQLDPLLGFYN